MFKSKVIFNINRRHKPVSLKLDYKLIIFFILFVCGVIIGGFITKNSKGLLLQGLSIFAREYFLSLNTGTYFLNFFKIFSPFAFICICTYIIGLCGVGIPFLTLIPTSLGAVMGAIISQYYVDFGLLGIGCCALIYLPLFATATATLLKGCCCSFDISGEIFYFIVSEKGNSNVFFKEYTIKHLFFLIPIALSSGLTLLFYHLFSGLFSFIV